MAAWEGVNSGSASPDCPEGIAGGSLEFSLRGKCRNYEERKSEGRLDLTLATKTLHAVNALDAAIIFISPH